MLLLSLLLVGTLHADEDPTITRLRARANEGAAGAQFILAEFYSDGSGVPKDSGEAARWYRKSAAQGYGEAQLKLGIVYLQGTGVAADPVEGLAWVLVAAGTGNVSLVRFREKLEVQLGLKVLDAAKVRAKVLALEIAANKRANAAKADK